MTGTERGNQPKIWATVEIGDTQYILHEYDPAVEGDDKKPSHCLVQNVETGDWFDLTGASFEPSEAEDTLISGQLVGGTIEAVQPFK